MISPMQGLSYGIFQCAPPARATARIEPSATAILRTVFTG
jgi:hypothetical protein